MEKSNEKIIYYAHKIMILGGATASTSVLINNYKLAKVCAIIWLISTIVGLITDYKDWRYGEEDDVEEGYSCIFGEEDDVEEGYSCIFLFLNFIVKEIKKKLKRN